MKLLAFFSTISYIAADMSRFTDMYLHLHSQHSLANTVAAGLETAIQDIDGYACWCKFGPGQKGKGAPINSIDSMCKLLYDGYQCIIMDFGGSCVPSEVSYNSGFTTGVQCKEDLERKCDQVNPAGSCEAAICLVEGYFIQSFFKIDLSKWLSCFFGRISNIFYFS